MLEELFSVVPCCLGCCIAKHLQFLAQDGAGLGAWQNGININISVSFLPGLFQ